MERENTYFQGRKIAYFTMELGLRDEIPTYSGGLGILAGDVIRSSADLNLPLICLTLINKKGYFHQDVSPDGEQIEYPETWDPSVYMTLLPTTTSVHIQEREVQIQAWCYEYYSPLGGVIPIFFLDTDTEANQPLDREITHYLYGGDNQYRLKQEIVLGIGGVRLIEKLGFNVQRYHMNEGHSGLLGVELLRRYGMDEAAVREQCIFTTHTPMAAGYDKFPYGMIQEIMGEIIPFEDLKRLGGMDLLNMTLLALNLSRYHNGVAQKHREVSKQLFPGYEINAITNGVHSKTWTCPSFRRLFDQYFSRWVNEPEILVRGEILPDEEVWNAHLEAKNELNKCVYQETNIALNPEVLTIGFARRVTGYKRATLLFSDLERLRKIGQKHSIQFIFAGKSHPRDRSGKKIIADIHRYISELATDVTIAYLKDYEIALAAKMVAGVDVWLNTPLRPFEASGTSGMKAAHNGVINFSVLDGWWIEGWIENITGWAIGPLPDEVLTIEELKQRELEDLYSKLEYIISPMFYQRRDQWIAMMKHSISKIAYYFNTHRMMRRYVTEAYL
jgi:starch phosphorylase